VREEFHAWLIGQRALVLPMSPLGEAAGYALWNWEALMRYTEQGYLTIDDTVSERALRQVVVGRANWQFCGSAEDLSDTLSERSVRIPLPPAQTGS
jgi:hypothetical protein